ncbi:MAG: RNA methyltransferase substrate-binding domain-containing protein, partial [Acidimicrobiia bacterium]
MALAGIGDRVEGLHAVAAALAAGRVEELTVERGRLDHPEVARLVEECRRRGVSLKVVSDLVTLATTTSPQG